MIIRLLISIFLIRSTLCLVHWPSTGISQCKPTDMSYDSYTSGMKVAGLLVNGSQTVTTVIDLPPQCAVPNANGTFNFVVNVPAGTSVALQVIDNSGDITSTPFLTVQVSETKNCLAPAYNSTATSQWPSSTVSASAQVYHADNYVNLSTGAIVGIAVGATAGFLLLGALLYTFIKHKNRKKSTSISPSLRPFDATSESNVDPSLYSNAPSPFNPNMNSNSIPYYPSSPSSPPLMSDISNNTTMNYQSGNGITGLEAPETFSYRYSDGNAIIPSVDPSLGGGEVGRGGGGGGGRRFPAEGMTPAPR